MNKNPSHRRFKGSQRQSTTTSAFAGLLLVIAVGCKETLPPYTPPQEFVQGILSRNGELGDPSAYYVGRRTAIGARVQF